MSSETLISLAMLKVNIDASSDYLDYLRPFILQVLVDHKPDPVTDAAVHDLLLTQFGLEIPRRTVQIVLKRISRAHPLKRESGVYHITGALPQPGIPARKSEAERHINAVVSDLIEFSKKTAKPITASDKAVTAICTFLAQFSIPCLRAYLQGTAIPKIEDRQNSDIMLVSQYVMHLQQTNPERFESFLIMMQGHMLANALLCPDLQNAPKTYKGMTFYLDTPLLVRQLGLEGEIKRAAIENLINLLRNLGATVATFSHSRTELTGVVRGAARNINSPDGRGAIVMESRRNGVTKSDLLLLVDHIDDKLSKANIEIENTPSYITRLQIDEEIFEDVLEDEISYFNPRAREYDINSVRSIYVLRAGTSPSTLEKSQAVLVSSNAAFARAAYKYGQQHEEACEVSSVITDFSLANMAWLKAPMGAPSLPTTEILAFSYAALRPSKKLLNKYLEEIDKLEKQGKIMPRDHQFLRSSVLAQEELMRLILGDEDALTEETITETLRRVSDEIKKEESQKLSAEQVAHHQTIVALDSERARTRRIQEQLYWRCSRRAKCYSQIIASFVVLLLIGGIIGGLGLTPTIPILGWIIAVGSLLGVIITFVDHMIGFSVKEIQQRLERRFLKWLLKREAMATGLDLENFQ